ncbi:epoxide hydrolase family protein [Paracoccus niistensis]|uniref:Epoxide hydrolase family protein n=1 Tax=Paracoccus niistensis TaxID=632935 RepID=A0ABV6I0X1_9RHOB
MPLQPTRFELSVPQDAIDDLRFRLGRTRFPDEAPDSGWSHGADLTFMRDLAAYWREQFDWRAAEARLNAFPQYKVDLAGIGLHFLHVPGQGPDPHPLLLSHGWPGSVFEFLNLIPRLADPGRFGGDPADAFTVIAPSLPGFGLSFAPHQPRFSAEAMADCLASLMTDVLGYTRFGAQGGDWGSFIAARLGHAYPDRISGIHLNFLPLRRDAELVAEPTPEEARYLQELAHFLREEAGYQAIQGTRPQTLAYGLTDSPAGLAAWITEKFRAWSDCLGNLETAISRDDLLANISLYWFTGAINSSFWPYYARAHGPWPVPEGETVDVPTGYAAFPREILRPPRSLVARTFTDIRRWTSFERGGHFAALEQPDALAADIRAFFRLCRSVR